MKRLLQLLALTLAALLLPAAAHGARTVYTGQFLCDDRGAIVPMGGITVQLWRRGGPDFLPVEWVGGLEDQDFTNPDGTFSLTSLEPEDNHIVRIALRDENGVRLKDWTGINDVGDDYAAGRNDVPTRNIGAWMYQVPGQSPKCAVWRGFHRAMQDYRAIMGGTPGYGDLLIQWDGLNFGTPWAAHAEVYWPGGIPVSWNPGETLTAEHEFAHTFRHYFDGNAAHFLGDAVAYEYARNHGGCTQSNNAFAFNEGWAEYWAGAWVSDRHPWPNCPGMVSQEQYDIEGNVANALTQLEQTCFFLPSRAAMVQVLRDNRGRIHSFDEFRRLLNCTPFYNLVIPPPPPDPEPPSASPSQAAALARAQVRTIDRQIRVLQGQLARANRQTVELPCTTGRCAAELRRVLRPSLLQLELDQLQLVRTTLVTGDTTREQNLRRRSSYREALLRQRQDDARRRRLAARAAEQATRNMIRSARRAFLRDRSRATRLLRARLLNARARAAAARRRGRALPGLLLNQSNLERNPISAAPMVFVNPEPPPPAPTDPRPASTLDLRVAGAACPFAGKVGNFVIGGTLTPVQSGAQVTLTTTPPSGSPTTQTLTTDASGAVQTNVFMQTPGTWTFSASWPGSPSVRPATSATCQVTIT